jgi:hypothetical protein
VSGISFTADWRAQLARDSHPARRDAMRVAEETAVRVCAVDTGDLQSTIVGEAPADRMVGRLSAGDERVDYAAVVEVGGRPHEIRARGPWALSNARTRRPEDDVFYRAGPDARVWHPGTPAQPYLRPGVQAIGGIR